MRRSGTKLEYTAEQIVEWVKCRDDPIYFIEKYIKIVTVDYGLQPMKLYDFQKEIVLKATNHNKLITKVARQAGKSSTVAAFFCHYIIFNSDKTCAILANKAATAREILSRVQLAYEHLPSWIKHGVTEWNKGSFVLENGSRIIASATSGSAIRGFSVNCLGGDTKVTVLENEKIYHINMDELNKSKFIENDMSKQHHLFYKTTNTVNNKIYYGIHSTNDINDGYIGSGTKLIMAVEKYGVEKFQTEFQICLSREEASELERFIVDEEFIKRDDVYNVTVGGDNRTILSGSKNGFFGKKHTDDVNKKIIESRRLNYVDGQIPPPPIVSINVKTGKIYTDLKAVLEDFAYDKSNLEYPDSSSKRRFIEELCYYDLIEFENCAQHSKRVENYEKYLSWIEQTEERKLAYRTECSRRRLGVPTSVLHKLNTSLGMKKWIRNNREAFNTRIMKINTDPEKIRKMAEAHTGMKRSEESKELMSLKALQRIARQGGPSNKGTKTYHDPVTLISKQFKPEDDIPKNWESGTGKKYKKNIK